MIDYWKSRSKSVQEFLEHFRCTTEPIGGGTEYAEDGELVNYDVAVEAVKMTKETMTDKVCEWLYNACCEGLFTASNIEQLVNKFKKSMEE